jgi:hypothetical protein
MTASRSQFGASLKELGDQFLQILGVIGEDLNAVEALTDKELLVLAAWIADDEYSDAWHDGGHGPIEAVRVECDKRLWEREKQAVRFAAIRNQIRLSPERPV